MHYLREFCRFCLSFDGNFHNMSSGDILEKANCCIGDFEFYCNFPNLICTKCLEALDVFFNFRNRCLQSELILQRYVQILMQNKLTNAFVNKKLAVFVAANFGTQCRSKNVQKVNLSQRVQSKNDTSQGIPNPVHGFNNFKDDFLQVDTQLVYNDIQIKQEQICEIDHGDEYVPEMSPICEARTDQETLSEPILSFNNRNINQEDVSNIISDTTILRNALQNNTPLPLKVVKVSDDQRYRITHFLSKRKLDCTDQCEKRIKAVDYNLSEKNRLNSSPDELNVPFVRKRETFQDSFIETTQVKRTPTPSQIPIFQTTSTFRPIKPKCAKVSKKSSCPPKSQVNPQLKGKSSTVTDFESGIALHCILNIRNDTNETLEKNNKPESDTSETLKKYHNPKPLPLKNLNQKVGLKFVSLAKGHDNFVPVNSNKEAMVSNTWPSNPKREIVINNKEHNYSATGCGQSKQTMELSNCLTNSTNVTLPRMIIVDARDWNLLRDTGRAESVYLQELQPSNGASLIGPIPPITQHLSVIPRADTSHGLQSNEIHIGVPPLHPFCRNGCGL